MPTGNAVEARIAAVERTLEGLSGAVGQNRQRLGGIQQGIREAWMVIPNEGPPGSGCSTATKARISVTGCNSLSAPAGYSIQLTGPSSFNQTLTTDSLGQVLFDVQAAGAGSYTATYTGGANAGRFAIGASVTFNVNCGDNPASASLALVPATGYICIASCRQPIPKTLQFVDSYFSSTKIPAVWVSGNKWVACSAVRPIFSGGACLTVGQAANTVVHYEFTITGTLLTGNYWYPTCDGSHPSSTDLGYNCANYPGGWGTVENPPPQTISTGLCTIPFSVSITFTEVSTDLYDNTGVGPTHVPTTWSLTET